MFSSFLSTIIVEFALYPAVFPIFIHIFVKFFTNFLDFLCVFTIFARSRYLFQYFCDILKAAWIPGGDRHSSASRVQIVSLYKEEKMTIKEFALLAGVSVSTVSKIMNGKDASISARTREHVLKLAKEYNYVP